MADTPKKKLQQDALIDALVPYPGQQQLAKQLAGWLGKGATEGIWRLYLTPELDVFVEFAEADVLHTQSLDKKDSPLGGSLVWVKAGVRLQHTKITTRQVQADFLSGDVTSGYMSSTNANFPTAGARTIGPRGRTNDYVCSTNRHIPACQEPTDFGCGGWDPPGSTICPSGPFVCGQTAGCSNGPECSVGC